MSTTELTIEKMFGDPREIAAELMAFESDRQVLSDRRAELLEKYNNCWVAVYDGEVQTSAETLEELLANSDDLNLPRGRLVVSFIERNIRPLKL